MNDCLSNGSSTIVVGSGGGWRRLHNEEHHYLYTSPSFIRVIKLRMI